MSELANPYVGPRTFEKTEKDRFFGREREKRELLALTVSEQLVLFYAQSGAGKSSLINTCLIPDLEGKGFKVLPVGRVAGNPPPELNIENIYVFNLISRMAAKDVESSLIGRLSLGEFLSEKKYISFLPGLEENNRIQERIVLIIDQFEELFSTHPEQWTKRQGFFTQLAQAVEQIPYLWVVLVMREDFIALLEPYEYLLPGRLRVRYYMQRLSREAALKAIKMPVENLRPFADGVAEKLVDDLRGVQVGYKPDGSPDIKPGQYVEPVQLQVVCANLWNNLKPGERITDDDLQGIGDVNTSLGNYYAERVKEVAAIQKVNERKIRDWFTDKLISSNGVRTPILKEQDGSSGGLEGTVVEALHDLVRAEQRGGATFYELTHDRLVVPILMNNRKWREEHFNPLQRQARLWTDQKKHENWLLNGEALEEVKTWAEQHPDEVTELEREFLEACGRKADEAKLFEQEQSAKRLRRNIAAVSFLAIIAVTAAIVAFLFGAQANQLSIAKSTEAAKANAANTLAATSVIAERTARADADNAANLAQAGKLAVQSQISNDPQLSLLLAIEAIQQAHLGNILVAYDALRKAFEETEYRQFKGHTALINKVSFSPDSRWLASGSYDRTIRLWEIGNLTSGPIVLSGQTSVVYGLAFSPNSHWLAGGGDASAVQLWDMTNPTSAPLLLSGHTSSIYSLAFSSDGHWLASGSADKSVRLWDMNNLASDPIVLNGHTGYVYSLAFSPTEPLLASASEDGTIRIWDLTDPAAKPVVLPGSSAPVYSLAFSSDGRRLASGGKTGAVLLWDMTDPSVAPISLKGQTGPIYVLAFSPKSRWLASRSDDSTIRLWDMTTPASEPLLLNGQMGQVYSLAFSPDDHWLAGGGDGTVLVWNMASQNPGLNPSRLGESTGPVYSVAFSPDSHWLASGSEDMNVRLWDATTQFGKETLVSTYDIQGSLATASPIEKLAFSPDGIWLTSVDASDNAQIWNFQTGIPREPTVDLDETVYSLMYDPQSSTLFAGGDQANTIHSFPLGKEYPESADINFPGHKGAIKTLVYSNCPTGGCWASANGDNTVTYWTGNESITLNGKISESILSLAISPDNRWLAGGGEHGTILLWSLEVGQGGYKELSAKIPISLAQKSAVNALTFSQDSHWLASGGEDGTISAWEVSAETTATNEIYQFQDRAGPIHALAFSPHGRWLASGGEGAQIRLWDIANPQFEAITLASKDTSIEALAFSSDGRWMASGGENGTIQIWGPDSTKLIEKACQTVGRNFEWQEWKSYFDVDKPYQITCPTNPFPASVADHFLQPGDKLAYEGRIEDALLEYRNALTQCPESHCTGFMRDYIPDPLGRAQHQRALAFLDEGDFKARNGDEAGAIQQYEQALIFDPALLSGSNETPETRVKRINYTLLKQEISDLYYSGDYPGAAAKLRDAEAANPDTEIMAAEDADLVNNICWEGSVEHAVEVQAVCELLGKLAPENGDYRDSRGVNRAILENFPGAIEDFEYAVNWWKENSRSEALIQERKGWLELLRGGHNPFEEKMVFVPAGKFTMGDDHGRPNERPAHEVTLDAFLIDQTEVTNKMYSQCVSEGACLPPQSQAPPQMSSYYGDPKFDNFPVIYIDWRRARNYCEWAGRRLPTEAEWEKAARGDGGYTYPWGNGAPNNTLLNFANNKFTTEVGSYPSGASPYGALDMAGNVWEWVSDFYSDIYYAQSKDSFNPTGPRSTDSGILRGGAWDSTELTIRSTYRNSQGRAAANSEFGFRCALSIPSE